MNCPTRSFPIASHSPAPARRARLKAHFVQVAAEILTGYEALSDGARLTYLVLLSFDYLEREQGDHKGVVFPTVETLMAKRRKSRSTIYSHLAELEAYGLIETIPGVGWKLYNPPECLQDAHPTTKLSENSTAVTDDYSALQPYPQTSLPSADAPSVLAHAPTPEFRKSGQSIKDEEEEITQPKQKQYSMAEKNQAHGEAQRVVRDLQKFGFAPWLASKFLQRYGTQRVQRQLCHLEAQLKRGVVIQNGARWLYRAIECDYQFPQQQKQPPRQANRPQYHIGTLLTLPNGEAVYELIEHAKVASEDAQAMLSELALS